MIERVNNEMNEGIKRIDSNRSNNELAYRDAGSVHDSIVQSGSIWFYILNRNQFNWLHSADNFKYNSVYTYIWM